MRTNRVLGAAFLTLLVGIGAAAAAEVAAGPERLSPEMSAALGSPLWQSAQDVGGPLDFQIAGPADAHALAILSDALGNPEGARAAQAALAEAGLHPAAADVLAKISAEPGSRAALAQAIAPLQGIAAVQALKGGALGDLQGGLDRLYLNAAAASTAGDVDAAGLGAGKAAVSLHRAPPITEADLGQFEPQHRAQIETFSRENLGVMKALYGRFFKQAMLKMLGVEVEWFHNVGAHAFSPAFWGDPWRIGAAATGDAARDLALDDKEVVTMSALIASGLQNQIFLHMHGFLNAGGDLRQLAALIRTARDPRLVGDAKPLEDSFLAKLRSELKDEMRGDVRTYTDAEIEAFIAAATSKASDAQNEAELAAPTALNGFTRRQLSMLAAAISVGAKDRPLIKKMLEDASTRGAGHREALLILKHAEIYIGEAAAIGAAHIWDEANPNGDSLYQELLRDRDRYYPNPRFFAWTDASFADPLFEATYDMALAAGTDRISILEPLLERFLQTADERGVNATPEQLSRLAAYALRQGAAARGADSEAVRKLAGAKLADIARTTRSPRLRLLADDAGRNLETAQDDLDVGAIMGTPFSGAFKFKNLIDFASFVATGHVDPARLQNFVEVLARQDLVDDANIHALMARAIRIVGYPIVMNAWLAETSALRAVKGK